MTPPKPTTSLKQAEWLATQAQRMVESHAIICRADGDRERKLGIGPRRCTVGHGGIGPSWCAAGQALLDERDRLSGAYIDLNRKKREAKDRKQAELEKKWALLKTTPDNDSGGYRQ